MVYTNSVPQANDQISATQAPILANFQFLQTGLNQEHFFNPASTGLSMTHLKASMANLGTPEVLPAFTNGMYYVLNGDAKFLANDGTKCELTKGISAVSGAQSAARALFQWGRVSPIVVGVGNTVTLVNFPIIFSQIFNVQVTPILSGLPNGSWSIGINNLAPGGFTCFNRGSSAVTGFNWFATGRP